MFNHLRAKLVALAAFAASLGANLRDAGSKGPETTEHHLPGLKIKSYQKARNRASLPRAGREIMFYHDSKLGKRFAEAAYRNCRGY